MTMVSAMPVSRRGPHRRRARHQAVARHSPLRRSGAGANRRRQVTDVAIDETAARRGHDYITLFVDIDQARVLFATEGKDARHRRCFCR